MGLTVACVLRSGGDFRPEHVDRLWDGVSENFPGHSFFCLTDMDVCCESVPLKYGWPGWWSKMELFRPDLEGDFLYFDLDTIVLGDIPDFAGLTRLTVLSDFHVPDRVASGVMFIPQVDRAFVWNAWMKDATGHMRRQGGRGDQGFLQDLWGGAPERFQDRLPGQIVSYKVHVQANDKVPDDARVMCFHGRPRPWETRFWQ